jgi:tetratricopeptide (TPR) repeat protein
MRDPRARFIIEDGRNYLTHTDAVYDLISIEVGQVFRPGLASFYTADFYARARERLTEQGVLCQYAPISYFNPREFQIVIRTFLDVFPQSVLWYNTKELLLIGTVAEGLKLTERRLALLDSNTELHRNLDFAFWGGPAQHLNRPEVFVGGFLAGATGLDKLSAGAPIYRDDLPHLEYSTARRREDSVIPIVELIREHVEPAQQVIDTKLEPRVEQASQLIRTRNLGDIVANVLIRPVPALSAQGKSQEVIELLRQAVSWNEDNVHNHFTLARELVAQRQLEQGAHHYREVLRMAPHSGSAHSNLAQVLHAQGELDGAIQHYRRALQLIPNHAGLHYALGTALLASGRPGEAITHFRRTLSLQPGFKDAERGIAQAQQLKAQQENQQGVEEAPR